VTGAASGRANDPVDGAPLTPAQAAVATWERSAHLSPVERSSVAYHVIAAWAAIVGDDELVAVVRAVVAARDAELELDEEDTP
jgi:outer membrane protein TolC